MADLLDHLFGLLVIVAIIVARGADDHKDGESDKHQTDAFVEDFEEAEGDDALKERSQLALEDVHAQSGEEDAGEESKAFAEGEILFAADEDGDQSGPVEPDDGVEEIEDNAAEIDAETGRHLHVMEVDAVGVFGFGGVACFEEHGIKTEAGHDGGADIDDPAVVEERHQIVGRDMVGNEQQGGDDKDVAGTDAIGKGDGIAEAIMDAGLELGEESRAEAEEERESDTAYYAEQKDYHCAMGGLGILEVEVHVKKWFSKKRYFTSNKTDKRKKAIRIVQAALFLPGTVKGGACRCARRGCRKSRGIGFFVYICSWETKSQQEGKE